MTFPLQEQRAPGHCLVASVMERVRETQSENEPCYLEFSASTLQRC